MNFSKPTIKKILKARRKVRYITHRGTKNYRKYSIMENIQIRRQ
jgi:hypothetical protein